MPLRCRGWETSTIIGAVDVVTVTPYAVTFEVPYYNWKKCFVPSNRPSIGARIEREVRQRCHFGCVICGVPLYTYEHVLGWAKVRRHVAAEITLLCDKHQRESTNGLLPRDKIANANLNPFNQKSSESVGHELHYFGSESCRIVVGNNTFNWTKIQDEREMVALVMEGKTMLSFTHVQGHLLLTVQIFDEHGRRILWVEQNVLRYFPMFWDITLEGKTLTIRDGPGQFVLEIEFRPPNAVAIKRARFCHKGLEIYAQPDFLCYLNRCQTFSDCDFTNVTAICIGEPKGPVGFQAIPWNRGNYERENCLKWIRAQSRNRLFV